jgi:hypothetical protein
MSENALTFTLKHKGGIDARFVEDPLGTEKHYVAFFDNRQLFVREFPPGEHIPLEALQEMVGGTIEGLVSVNEETIVHLYGHDEGRILNPPLEENVVLQAYDYPMAGPVVFALGNEEGETLPTHYQHLLALIGVDVKGLLHKPLDPPGKPKVTLY